MASINIIQSDPEEYKEIIIKFWRDYLPGTLPERFDWMQKNPAGPAIWFFAIEENTNELVGTVSIMPREMGLNGEIIKAGIVGDFMVSNDYRVFGPALALQKTVCKSMTKYGFDYLYTVPNQASLKVMQRAGYVEAFKLVHYIKPVRSARYLQKYFNVKLSTFIGYVLDLGLKILSKETRFLSKDCFDEVYTVNGSFDAIWDKAQKLETGLIGNHSTDYINWRYIKNPISAFRIITLKSALEKVLLGYIVFSIIEKKIEIYDIVSLKSSYKNKLLRKVIHFARHEKCHAIYIRLNENSMDIKNLRRFMFFNAKNDASVLVFGEDVSIFDQWAFSLGDRNS